MRKRKEEFFVIDLQLFAEGGDGGGTAYGEGAQTGETGGVVQTEGEALDSAGGENAGEDLDAEFEELIKGKYKKQFDSRLERSHRSKSHKIAEYRKSAEEASELVNLLGTRYGLENMDAKSVMEAIRNDDAYWQDAASQAGMSVDQYRHMQEVEAQNKALISRYDNEQKQRAANEQVQRWIAQEEECRNLFPGFDFEKELENPAFVQHLQNGMTILEAYKFMHMDDLITGSMQMAAAKVGEKAAAAVRSNVTRPVEGAVAGGQPTNLKVDIKNMSEEEFNKLQERVYAGEIIRLS